MTDVARFFGVSHGTVRSEWRTTGMPVLPDGGYDLSAIYQWKQSRLQKHQRGGDEEGEGVGGSEVNRRHKLAEMLKAEEDLRAKKLKNDRDAGGLLDRDEVRREVVEWAVRLRTKFLTLTDRIVGRMPGELKATIKLQTSEAIRVGIKEALDAPIAGEAITEMILAEAERLRECERSDS